MSIETPVEWIDYIFIEDEKSSTVPIKILTGEYNDVIFNLGKVSFDLSNDAAVVRFTFNVISPKNKIKSLEKSADFKAFISKILDNILYTEVMDEDRESYTEVPSERQRVRAEDPTFS